MVPWPLLSQQVMGQPSLFQEPGQLYVRGDGTLVIEVDDPTVEVSLDGEELSITGAGIQELKLRHCFHTLSRHLYVEALSHGNGCTHDTLMAVVLVNVGNEVTIEDETVNETIVERLERDVAGAEMIE